MTDKVTPSPRPRLLLVEDDPATRVALEKIFQRFGWTVNVAATIAEAAVALDHEPDFVILDLMLPDGNGATVLRAIRESGRPVRVVVTTGTSDPDQLELVRSLQPEALIIKPVRFPELLTALGFAPDRQPPT